MLHGKSFWQALVEIAAGEKIWYHAYSYGRRADIYRLNLDGENSERIAQAVKRLAPRKLQNVIHVLTGSASILFVCPRLGNTLSR